AGGAMPRVRGGELSTIGEMSRAQFGLCDARFAADLEAASIPGLKTLLYGGGGPHDLTRLAAARPAAFDVVATSSDDVCMFAFTSGTTRRPKAPMHFHPDPTSICGTLSPHVLRPTP